MEKYYQAYDKRYQQIHNLKLQWSSDVVTPILQELTVQFGIRKTDKILEIGCGEGRDALWLLEQGYDILATDVSKEAISYCKRRTLNFPIYFPVRCMWGTLTSNLQIYLFHFSNSYAGQPGRSKSLFDIYPRSFGWGWLWVDSDYGGRWIRGNWRYYKRLWQRETNTPRNRAGSCRCSHKL